MKRLMCLFLLFLYLFSHQPTMYAAGISSGSEPSVYDSIHEGGKKFSPQVEQNKDTGSSAIFPLFFKFLISFLFVIALLFLLMRFLAKRNRFIQANGPILPLGAYALGNNRSLQVVLIGQTVYILGVGETITLIRSIPKGEEYQHLLECFENQTDGIPSKWIPDDMKMKWSTVIQKNLANMKKANREE